MSARKMSTLRSSGNRGMAVQPAAKASISSKLHLEWHEHGRGLTELATDLCGQSELADCSLSCAGGEVFNAHRMVLAGASTYFRRIFHTLDFWKQPVVFLPNIKSNTVEHLLQFIYYGEVSLPSEELNKLVSVAKDLGISGLDDVEGGGGESDSNDSNPLASRKRPRPVRPGPASKKVLPRASPPATSRSLTVKKERYDEDDSNDYSAAVTYEEDLDDDNFGGGDDHGNDDGESLESAPTRPAPQSRKRPKKTSEDEDEDYNPGKSKASSGRKPRRSAAPIDEDLDISGFAWASELRKKRDLSEVAIYSGAEGDQVVDVLSSQKKQPMVAMNGYTYYLRKATENQVFWKCKEKDCYGTLTTDIHYLAGEAGKNHTHPRNIGVTEKAKFIAKMKRLAFSTDKAPGDIYEELMAGVEDDKSVRAALPDRKHVIERIRKHRQRLRDKLSGKIPSSSSGVKRDQEEDESGGGEEQYQGDYQMGQY